MLLSPTYAFSEISLVKKTKIVVTLFFFSWLSFITSTAHAQLQFCNWSDKKVYIALHWPKDDFNQFTEYEILGWFTNEPRSCVIPDISKAPLKRPEYYYYAYREDGKVYQGSENDSPKIIDCVLFEKFDNRRQCIENLDSSFRMYKRIDKGARTRVQIVFPAEGDVRHPSPNPSGENKPGRKARTHGEDSMFTPEGRAAIAAKEEKKRKEAKEALDAFYEKQRKEEQEKQRAAIPPPAPPPPTRNATGQDICILFGACTSAPPNPTAQKQCNQVALTACGRNCQMQPGGSYTACTTGCHQTYCQ